MWNGVDPRGMMRIRVEWCGSVRTGVESVLVRAEHQGEGKLLGAWLCGSVVFRRFTLGAITV